MATTATAYVRVSSKGQLEGHGPDRQLEAITAHAKRAGFKLIATYTDAFTGTEADRPAFQEMVTALLSNGCRTIIVEDLSRLAREYRVQETLLVYLASKGLTLIAANTGENVTGAIMEDPMRKALVQIQGIFAELDKALLVRKMRKAREAKRVKVGKCEGRKAYGEKPGEADIVAEIFALRRKPKGQPRLSFKAIADQLNAEGRPTRCGGKWSPATVQGILGRGRGKA